MSVPALGPEHRRPIVVAAPVGGGRDRLGRRAVGGDGGPGDSAAAPLRVLVVEDEALVALTLEAMLQDIGHVVVGIAAGPGQAIDLAARTEPDVVLMDVRLGPAGDEGIGAALGIRGRVRAAIVFVTAHADRVTLGRIQAAVPGAMVLAKPVDRTDLADAIDGATQRGT